MAKFSVSNLDSLEVTGGSITGITDLLVADVKMSELSAVENPIVEEPK